METWTEEDAMEAAHSSLPFTLGISDDGRYAIRAIKGSYETMSLVDHLCDCVNWNPDRPHEIYRKALALHGQPAPAPKREPSALLKAAKEAATQLDYLQKYAPVNFAWSDRMWRAKDALNAAIAREEAKSATDEKLREAVRYYCTRGADGGNGYATLYAAAKDAGIVP